MVKRNFLTKMLLLCALVVGSVSASRADVIESNFTDKNASVGEGELEWTATNTNSFESSGSARGVQSSKNQTAMVFTSDPTQTATLGTITKVVVTASSNGNGRTMSVTVGGNSFDDDQTVLNGSNYANTEYTFEGSASGTIVVSINPISSNSTCWIKKIEVTYTSSSNPAAVTTVTIDDSGIENTDVYSGTTAGSLSATVKAGETAIEGATVTWSGNNDDVATINASTGAVTLVAAGTVTFTASYAGVSGTYQSSSATYVLTVTDSTPIDGDVLDRAFTGVTNGTTSYSNWSDKTGASGAVYAGNSAGGNDAIQLRSNNNNSGIVTTTSGGKVKKVTVAWNSNTSDGRTIDIYGKSTAYSAATDLYNNSTYGTKIGSIVCGTSTSLTIEGDCEYIGIRSNSGALYLDQIVIKWEASNKTATTTTITSNITNTDVYTSTEAGSLSATVTAGDNEVSGATVTWSSSNEDVATIDENGVVTLVAAGTTTITASYAGDATYQSSSATYELTVTSSEPYVQPMEVDISLNNNFFGTSYNGSLSADEKNALRNGDGYVEGTKDNIVVQFAIGESSNFYISNDQIRVYEGTSITVTAPTDYLLSKVEFVEPSSGKSWAGTHTSSPTGYDDDSKSWSGSSNTVTVTFGGTCRIAGLNVTLAKPVNISSYKWATFSSDQALDFTNSDVKAYIVTGFEGTSITKKQVYVVPANTGLLLNAEAGTYGIPVATEETEDVSENNLHAVLGGNETVSEGTGSDVNYVLSVKSGKVVFAWIGSTSATVKDGQAYLTLVNGPKPTGNAPWLSLEGDDDTTGIQNIERTINDNQYYTLDGRRVAEPTKGIYIINGKKVVIK